MADLNARPLLTRPAAVLLLILALAVGLRAHGLAFGLPALYDPDEPLFVLSALKLLREQTLDPGWFGHPGTTTIYALALVDILVFAGGWASGQFAGAAGFGKAVYANSALVFLPGRMFILLCGVACVYLTYRLGRRLFGVPAGLLAAALLAVDPVHVRYSQLIRTDVHATVFMLLCLLSTANIARRGRWRDYIWAGIWVGFATATKWPAAIVAVAIVGAGLSRAWRLPHQRRRQLLRIAAAGAISVAALIVASPYLLLDYPTVIANLSGEARPHHLGATGFGFSGNLGWYVAVPLRRAVGILGLVLAGVGIVIAGRRSRSFRVAVLPAAIVFLIAISAQALIWERWVVPLLPILALGIAVAVLHLAAWLRLRLGGAAAALMAALAAAAVAVPALARVRDETTERINDTRRQSTAWVRTHIPPRSTVILEYLALDLLAQDWRFLFPVGDGGCVDMTANLQGKIRYSTISKWRGNRAVINLGTIAPATLPSCRADYAIFVDYDRYRAEPALYGAEIAVYEHLLAQGEIVRSFYPEAGAVGGPIVRIVRFRHGAGGQAGAAVLNRHGH